MSDASKTKRVQVTDIHDQAGKTSRIIELNRPEKLNCLDLAMLDELLSALEGTGTARLLLTGAGRAFCTGLDLSEIRGPGGPIRQLEKIVAVYRHLLERRSPTVILASGFAMGGGAGMVLCARRTIVSEDFRFRLPSGDLSRLAAVAVPLCTLRAASRAPANMNWLGCDLTAAQAREYSLVDHVIPTGEMGALIQSVRTGSGWPDLFEESSRAAVDISQATKGLEEFLSSFVR
jgi:enoyl-CoA hydratase/carnithine racemase